MMKRKFKKHISYFLLFISLLVSKCLLAINDHERNELSRVVSELDVIMIMIEDAKRAASKQSQIQFDYQVLTNDLNAVKQGINDYVNSSRRDPRELFPVDGVYRQ